MVSDVIVHKSDTSVGVCGGGKEKKVSVIGIMENNSRPTSDKEGREALSIEVSMVEGTCFGVASPFGS